MNESKIIESPTLQYVILCDAIARDQSEKLIYVGAFDKLIKPGTLPQFIIALKWICGLGSHTYKFKILNPELQTEHETENFKMQFKAKTDSFFGNFPMINFNFKQLGVYWIEIILNNNSYLSIPLPVHEL